MSGTFSAGVGAGLSSPNTSGTSDAAAITNKRKRFRRAPSKNRMSALHRKGTYQSNLITAASRIPFPTNSVHRIAPHHSNSIRCGEGMQVVAIKPLLAQKVGSWTQHRSVLNLQRHESG